MSTLDIYIKRSVLKVSHCKVLSSGNLVLLRERVALGLEHGLGVRAAVQPAHGYQDSQENKEYLVS